MFRVICILMFCSLSAFGQKPQKFHKVLPPGNYEGLCQVAPNLLILVADSQNRFKGFLRDGFLLHNINQR